jgi:hypothetical protein
MSLVLGLGSLIHARAYDKLLAHTLFSSTDILALTHREFTEHRTSYSQYLPRKKKVTIPFSPLSAKRLLKLEESTEKR